MFCSSATNAIFTAAMSIVTMIWMEWCRLEIGTVFTVDVVEDKEAVEGPPTLAWHKCSLENCNKQVEDRGRIQAEYLQGRDLINW